MLTTRGNDSRAAAALIALLQQRNTTQPSAARPGGSLGAALITLAALIRQTPVDQRVDVLSHMLTVFDPHLFETGVIVDAINTWTGEDPDIFLTTLADLAAHQARHVMQQRPERALAYTNYCHRLSTTPLLAA